MSAITKWFSRKAPKKSSEPVMAIEERWLGRGWYWMEASDESRWVWSSDVAYLNPAGCDRFDLKFFTRYSDFTGAPQLISVFVDDKVQSTAFYAAGHHEISIACAAARSVRLQADGFCPAQYPGLSDRRVLGIGLYDLVPTLRDEPVKDQREDGINISPGLAPITMQVEVSTACHLSCVMCSRSEKSGGPSQHMTKEIWDNFFGAARHAHSVNFLGLGEPWTHRRFLEMLEQLDQAGVATSITTTGDLINDERAALLGKLQNLRELTFSIDSPDPDTYLKIRGQPLSRALKGLDRSVRAISDPDIVRVHAVVMRDSLPSLAGFPELLRQYSVRRFVMRGVTQMNVATREMVPEYTKEERDILIGIKDEAEASEIAVSLLPTLPPDLIQIATSDFVQEQDSEVSLAAPVSHIPDDVRPSRICMDPWEKAIVTRDGDVYPCECYHLQKAVGSLASQSFQDIWRGEDYAAMRRGLLNDQNLGCRSCERRGWGYHPLNLFAAEILSCTVVLGGDCEIRLRNTGKVDWSEQCVVRLGTARPRDRAASAFAHEAWISPSRVAGHVEPTVKVGEVGTFRFKLALPAGLPPPEYFQFLVEHQCWLPNTEILLPEGHSHPVVPGACG